MTADHSHAEPGPTPSYRPEQVSIAFVGKRYSNVDRLDSYSGSLGTRR
jgi:hypothetical protein